MRPEFTHIVNLFYDNKQFISTNNVLRGAIFLDRDGVIIKDKNYIRNPDDVELEIGAKDLIRYFFEKGIPIVVVTNQSGIFRNFFSWEDYIKVNNRILELLGDPNPITAIYANGLGPNSPSYSWRKPSPEMLINASFTLKINLKKSILIGDRFSDIMSAFNGGIRKVFHVETGHGKFERSEIINFIKNNNFKIQEKDFDVSFIKNLNEFDKRKIDDLFN